MRIYMRIRFGNLTQVGLINQVNFWLTWPDYHGFGDKIYSVVDYFYGFINIFESESIEACIRAKITQTASNSTNYSKRKYFTIVAFTVGVVFFLNWFICKSQ